MSSLFFYGTLVHPAVLQRVVGRSIKGVEATALEYKRVQVLGEDYPALVASPGSSVVGLLVQGLTSHELRCLDAFEGTEYALAAVQLHVAGVPSAALTYVWAGPAARLMELEWSYEDFLANKAHRWGSSSAEYVEVNSQRAQLALPPFGRAMCKEWSFESGWVNLNHGSYGAAPNAVISAMRGYQERAAGAPDRFMRVEYAKDLVILRHRLSDLVQCDVDDLVMVPNATAGVNVVLRSLSTVYQKNDKLLYYSTTIYDACAATLQYIVDTHPHLNLSLVAIPLVYPVTHEAILATTAKVIAAENAKGNGKIRLALFDAISSMPGVIVPWEDLVLLFRQQGILSLVDAAHQIGQLPVELRVSQPDFWLSNCHKWLMGHRACAVLYVAKAHQNLIHSMPTGYAYQSRPVSSPTGEPAWIAEFAWNGTCDWAPFLSLLAALDFRQACGGEAVINKYCHTLAVEGGELVAQLLGTAVMKNGPNESNLIANMVNVRLPIECADASTVEGKRQLAQQKTFLYSTLMNEHSTQIPSFVHDGAWYARFSAQVYVELEDFAEGGRALLSVCRGIERGDHLV